MKIILGSESKGRKKILKKMGYDFDIMPANIDEKAIRSDDLEKLTLMLARAKAKALLPKIKEPALLITSDQVGVCNGCITEKPEDEAQAKQYLNSYKNHSAKTVTAVVVTNTATGKQVEGVDIAEVDFIPMPQNVINKYIEIGDTFSQSGAFSVDHPMLKKYVKKIRGEEESVIGLPVKLTKRLLKKAAEKQY